MNTGNETDLSNYVANGEWDLVEARVERNVVFYSCCQVYMNLNFVCEQLGLNTKNCQFKNCLV